MGMFGASFEDKVKGAVAQVQQQTPGIASLAAQIDGKTVTLTGTAVSLEAKTAAMQAFNALVQTDNTINMIRVLAPAPTAPKAVEAPPPQEVIHEVQRGETLSGIAKQYLGKASLYMKIFEANRDVLVNPDLIKPGQKLRIPKL